MTTEVGVLIEKIRGLEHELEAEIARRRIDLKFGIERGRVVFEREILQLHRRARTSLWRYIVKGRPLVVLTAPFILSLIVPLLLLDLFVSLYHAVCFPAYGLTKVRRKDYLVFDRHHLAYLNVLEKLNCAYCSYANGLIAYVREIASRTEQYWCPIKHASRLQGTHPRYADFADFGDADAFARELAEPHYRQKQPEKKPL